MSLNSLCKRHLVDRDPEALHEAFQSYRRVVVLGDALHGMSPFKGQGANQALQDGPLVAKWLLSSRPDAAVRGIWREAVQRTAKVVKASRQAAGFWHSPACLSESTNSKQERLCSFAGVKDNSCDLLLKTLHQRQITANLADTLDYSVEKVIEELQVGESIMNEDEKKYEQFYAEILDYSVKGDTEKLRHLSLAHAPAIRLARNDKHQSALHLAAMNGHYRTCHWLLTETFMDPTKDVDSVGNSPLDYASDPLVHSLFQQVIKFQTKKQ